MKALISFIFYFEQAMEDANIENELNCKDTRLLMDHCYKLMQAFKAIIVLLLSLFSFLKVE